MYMRLAAGFFFSNAAVFFGCMRVKEITSHQTQTAVQSLAKTVFIQSLHYCTLLLIKKTDEISSSAA